MNTIITLLKSILFLINIFKIIINLVMPIYFRFRHNYKIHWLKDKNIPTNINHQQKIVYSHFWLLIYSFITLIVLFFN